MFLLHGIFGSGNNLRPLASRLVERRPEWGMVLVDLRQHGRSQNASPPHTMRAAAQDLIALAATLARDQKPVRAVCGHSFGGKVALAYRAGVPDVEQTWMLDSSPSARPNAMYEHGWANLALTAMESMPPSFPTRDAFVALLTGRGFAPPVATWLATNLDHWAEHGDYRLRLDLLAMRALLSDYYASDLWEAACDEEAPGSLHVVAAGRSDALSPEDLEHLEQLERHKRSAAPVHLHRIPDAGHWVHVEALDPLSELVAAALPTI
jgi:pimeloyl-ACP methyl ester carboxylesterase